MMAEEQVRLTAALAGQRLDQALTALRPERSRVQWQRALKAGHVLVDGRPARPSQRVAGGERLTIDLPPVQPTTLLPEAIPLNICYEDDDMLVVDKPAGMVVHPAAGHESGTLVNAVLAHCRDLPGVGGERRPGIVHRLDKETSGLIVVAKHDAALHHLQAQFKARTVGKYYLALVDGVVQPPGARIDAPIGRDPRRRKRMAVIPPGSSARAREAQTDYETVMVYHAHTLLRCRPHTGRTHQIRVHLAFAGYPIVGDSVYGRRRPSLPLKRHFLHAAELTLRRPSDDALQTFEAPLPAALQRVLTQLAQEL